jgi:hypothetical protein
MQVWLRCFNLQVFTFPPECINQMFHIRLQKVVHDAQRIFIGAGIEIQSAAEKMFYGVGHEELFGGSGITTYFKEYTADAVGCAHYRIVDLRGLGSMLVGEVEGIVDQFIEIIFTDLFITDIDLSIETREIDIDPIRILGLVFKKSTVLYYIGIYGILKGVWIAWSVKDLVFMFGKIDPEITFSFGRIGTVAANGYGHGDHQANNDQWVLFNYLPFFPAVH